MFNCKVCAQKDLRIDELNRYIDVLTKLAFPPKESRQAFIDSMEANKILDGDFEQIQINPEQEQINEEATKILNNESDAELLYY